MHICTFSPLRLHRGSCGIMIRFVVNWTPDMFTSYVCLWRRNTVELRYDPADDEKRNVAEQTKRSVAHCDV